MTKAERKFLDRVAAMGCLICRKLGYPDSPACIHHQRSGVGKAQRASNYQVIPLCHFHHQGQEGIHHMGLRAWEKHFGITEVELVAQVQHEVGIVN